MQVTASTVPEPALRYLTHCHWQALEALPRRAAAWKFNAARDRGPESIRDSKSPSPNLSDRRVAGELSRVIFQY